MVGKDLEVELRRNGQVELPPNVLVYTIEGPLFFGAAETFERVLAQTHTDPGTLIIRLNHVPFMDITGLQSLLEVIEQLRNRGIVVKLCEANEKVLGKLHKAGILEALGPGDYHADFSSALGGSDSAKP